MKIKLSGINHKQLVEDTYNSPYFQSLLKKGQDGFKLTVSEFLEDMTQSVWYGIRAYYEGKYSDIMTRSVVSKSHADLKACKAYIKEACQIAVFTGSVMTYEECRQIRKEMRELQGVHS